MAAFLVWVFQMILDYHETINQFVDSSWASYLIDGLYYIVPKTSAIGDMAILLARDQPVDSWMPLWSSLIFALAMYYFAARVFDRKDY